MKQIPIVTLAIAAVACFFGALAASAFAEEPLWSTKGTAVTSAKGIETALTLTMADTKVPLVGEAAISCEAKYVGTVNTGGKAETTEVLNTAGEKISSTPLTGLALLCATLKACENSSVWPVGLPWKRQLETPGESTVFDDTTSSSTVGYEVECTILGIKESDECVSTLTAPFVENLPTEPTASVFEIVNQNHVNCSLGGEGAGEIVGEGSAKNSEGESIGVIGASKPIDIIGDPIFGQGTILKELFELFMLGTTLEILIILLVQFGSPKGSEYRFRAVLDECEKLMNKELQKGQSCKMGVTFEPMGKEMVTAQLEFIYEEKVLLLTNTISVSLQGSGI